MYLFDRTKRFSFLLAVLALSFPLFGQDAAQLRSRPLAIRPQVRVTDAVDNKVRTTLHGNLPAALARSTETGRLDGAVRMDHMLLVLQASSTQEQALRTLTDQQNEKASAYFHKWITPEQFGQSFGVNDTDIAAVTGWLQSQGMTIDQVPAGKRLIEFSGTVAQVEAAFQTEMHTYSYRGEQHVSASKDITIPTALAPVVAALPTLHNFFKKSAMTKPMQQTAPIAQFPALVKKYPELAAASNANGVKPEITSGTTHYFGAIDFQTVYNSAPLINGGDSGAGVTIGVMARTDIGLNDVQIYRTLFGLPNNDPTFTVVGEDPGVVAGDDGESYLDVEVSGGVAPLANINFITSKASLTTDGVDLSAIYAVQNNSVDIITESYGECEAVFGGSSVFQFYTDLWGQAAAQGISVFVSTGDNGPASCDSDSATYSTYGYAVSLLSSSPYNVAVGGSMFVEGSGTYWSTSNGAGYESALSYIPEQPWNESYKNDVGYTELCGLCSGGGGVSAYFTLPSYQRGVGINPAADPAYPNVTTSDPSSPYTAGPHRLVPDVTLNAAGGHDGTVTCGEGSCQITASGIGFGTVGGTSVAAPSMAGVQALVDAANGGRQGNPNFHYYALAAANSAAGLNCAANGPPAAGCAFHDFTAGDILVCGNSTCTSTKKVGWSATAGYDEASGLGSANVLQLATQWNTVTFTSSVTSLSITPTAGLIHGQVVKVNITVAPGTGSGTPTGQVALYSTAGTLTNPTNLSTGGFLNQPAYCTLSGGACTISLGSLPAGSYNVYARYVGDPTYGSSTSAAVPVSVAKETSTTTLSANTYNCTSGAITAVTSIPYGSAVLFDTTVAGTSGQGVPTGTISLMDGATTLLTPSLNAQGISEVDAGAITSTNSASCLYGYLYSNLASLVGGTHTLSASYAGDTNFGTSTSSNYTLTVTPVALTAALKTTAAGIASGASTTLTFLLTPLDASAQPVNATGTVTFTDTTSGTTLGTGTVSRALYNNVAYYLATLPTTGITSTGANTITATYAGDSNYASSSATATVMVGATLNTVTVSTLVASVNPGSVGVTDTLTYTATSYSSATAPTGTVYFYANGTAIGSSTLSATAHTATLSTRAILGAGNYTVIATYSGSATYASSSSPALALTINKTTPTVNLTVKAGSTLGSSATLTVLITVPAPTSGTTYNLAYIAPTGTTQYYDNGNALGSPVALTPTVTYASGGTGLYETVLTVNSLTTGSHTITATYTDNNYTTTTTNSQTITINQYTPSITVSAPSAVYATGATVPLTALVTVPSATAPPTGLVTFSSHGASLGTGSLSLSGGGVYSATLSTTLPSGYDSVTATYAGDANYVSVSSVPITEIITTNNVWVANGNNTVSALTSSGTAVTASAVSGGGTAIAIDYAGDVWSLNKGGNSVAEFSNGGLVISGGYTGGGLNLPSALTIDGAGLVWVTNGNSTLSVLSNSGAPVSPTAYNPLLSTPTSINVDSSGDLWITNSGDNSVVEVIGAATPVTTPQTTAVKNSTQAAKP